MFKACRTSPFSILHLLGRHSYQSRNVGMELPLYYAA